ncbi:hypothetical protein AEM51_08700 [Bacteroidetes bacterium UKL13-3]|jgi:hypothetical protein|nr:hypothetical protein AEM51_08700 [Bacteroidetes bacterium UKL13-3]
MFFLSKRNNIAYYLTFSLFFYQINLTDNFNRYLLSIGLPLLNKNPGKYIIIPDMGCSCSNEFIVKINERILRENVTIYLSSYRGNSLNKIFSSKSIVLDSTKNSYKYLGVNMKFVHIVFTSNNNVDSIVQFDAYNISKIDKYLRY